jgi:hypothetical protein
MNQKNLYEIRGKFTKENLEDNLTVDYYTEVSDAIAQVNAQNYDFPNATKRKQIVDTIGLKF